MTHGSSGIEDQAGQRAKQGQLRGADAEENNDISEAAGVGGLLNG